MDRPPASRPRPRVTGGPTRRWFRSIVRPGLVRRRVLRSRRSIEHASMNLNSVPATPPERVSPPPPTELEIPVVGGLERIGTRVTARVAMAFYACQPPNFDGGQRQLSTRDWLHRITSIMRSCDIDSDNWVMLAISLFVGDACTFGNTVTRRQCWSRTGQIFVEV